MQQKHFCNVLEKKYFSKSKISSDEQISREYTNLKLPTLTNEQYNNLVSIY